MSDDDEKFKKGKLEKPKYIFGRPSKYEPIFCLKLIKHMANGFSYESFAATIDVMPSTLYEWESKHEDFSEAKQFGNAKRRMALENILLSLAEGKEEVKNGNVAAAIFLLKNAFRKDWYDGQKIEHTAKIESSTTYSGMTESEKKKVLSTILKSKSLRDEDIIEVKNMNDDLNKKK